MADTFKVEIEAVISAFGHSMIDLVGRILALDGTQGEIRIRFINSQVDFDAGSLLGSKKITVESYPMLGKLGFLRFDQRLGTIVFEHPFLAWNFRVTSGKGGVSAVRIENDLEITVSLESSCIEFKGSVAGMVTDEKGREAYPFDVSSICLPIRFSDGVESFSIRVKVPTISTFIACMFEQKDETARPVALGEDYIWPRGITARNIGRIRPPPNRKGVIRRFFDQDGAWFTYQTKVVPEEITYVFWTLLRRGGERLLAWIPATVLMLIYLIVLGSNASPGIQTFSVAFSIIMGVLAVFVTTMLPRLPRAACVLTFQTFGVVVLSIAALAVTALMVSLEALPTATRISWIVVVMLASLYWFNWRSLKMVDGRAVHGAFFDKKT